MEDECPVAAGLEVILTVNGKQVVGSSKKPRPRLLTVLRVPRVSPPARRRRGRPTKTVEVEERPRNCGLCDFRTEDVSLLRDHLKNHSNQTAYECPFCSSTFSQKGNLMTHIRTHTNDRPYKCPSCTFAASQKINLQVHLRTHTKEKPYKCDACDYSTAQKCNLIAHRNRKHPFEKEDDARFYRCKECAVEYRRKQDLLTHIELFHPGVPFCVQWD